MKQSEFDSNYRIQILEDDWGGTPDGAAVVDVKTNERVCVLHMAVRPTKAGYFHGHVMCCTLEGYHIETWDDVVRVKNKDRDRVLPELIAKLFKIEP